MKKNRFIEVKHVRTTKQNAATLRIQKRGTCPFCTENLKKEHKKPILRTGKYWTLTKAQFPYEEARMHFLIISKKHAKNISDLNIRSGNELFSLLQWLEK